MEKYAIIKLGGKQFMVREGDQFRIERQSSLNMYVLLFSDGKTVMVGSPIVEGVKIKGEIVKGADPKGTKIRVGRFRNKSRHRRIKGHTQPMSTIKINSITSGDEKPVVVKKTSKSTVKKKVKASPKRKVVAKTKK